MKPFGLQLGLQLNLKHPSNDNINTINKNILSFLYLTGFIAGV